MLTCPVCADEHVGESRVVRVRSSDVDTLHKCYRCGTVIIVPHTPEAAGVL